MDTNSSRTLVTRISLEGERSLYAAKALQIEDVTFQPGESALKHGQQIYALRSQFMGKYPFWNCNDVFIDECEFTSTSRAAIWYSEFVKMTHSVILAPKMFRKVRHLRIENSRFLGAGETLWNCNDIKLKNVELVGADYVFMNCIDIEADALKLQGNYSFQDAKNVVVRNSHLDSKDAFWNAENVTVYDSVLEGEYLGWHSKNLRLVNCTIKGTQPLCYATDLVLENCEMIDTDLCFEYSTLKADIRGEVLSVKNPTSGVIKAGRIGEIIIDENCDNPFACRIIVNEAAAA